MGNWNLIVGVVLVVVILTVVVMRRANRGVDPTQLLLDPDLIGRVRGLARTDRKIQAIKLLRDGTPGLGLAAAKLMVDRMAAAPHPVEQPKQVDLGKDRPTSDSDEISVADLMPSTSSVPLDIELEARSLKSTGQPIAAVKIVRPHTRNLREAKDYVDGL